MEFAATQHAHHQRPRHGGPRRRSGGRHLRPRLLDSRRPDTAAPDRPQHHQRVRRSSSAPKKPSAFVWIRIRTRRCPPEMPAGQNPPNGAIVDYLFVGSSPRTISRSASTTAPANWYATTPPSPRRLRTEPPPNVPEYWVGHPEPLTESPGMNRFVWDLRYAAPPVLRHEYPISALYQNTPGLPLGATVTPGKYSVHLTVNGRTFEQPLEVAMDPRVDVSPEALSQQLTLEQKILDLVASSYEFYKKAVALRQTLAGDQKQVERKHRRRRRARRAERVRSESSAPARFRRRSAAAAGADGKPRHSRLSTDPSVRWPPSSTVRMPRRRRSCRPPSKAIAANSPPPLSIGTN